MTTSAQVRELMGHPVVDADGHLGELLPLLVEFLQEVGGQSLVDKYQNQDLIKRYVHYERMGTKLNDRRYDWRTFDAWWGGNTVTIDRAMMMLPKLLESRMDELGLDYTILYPSAGTLLPRIADEELRLGGCRAYNNMVAELYGNYPRTMTPVAIIPMFTPDEAIAELEHAVGTLGLKTVVMGALFPRPIKMFEETMPEASPFITHVDLFGIDSDYDYDPVWAKCQELGVAPTFHSNDIGMGARRSISSYVFNHVGGFGAGGDAIAKALFLGGVTRRFPDLNFAFMEGGVGWACSLFADLIGHWEKRGAHAIHLLDPERVDVDEVLRLVQEMGEPRQQRSIASIEQFLRRPLKRPDRLDEFDAVQITKREEFLELFVEPYYFGCEADTATNAWAFDTKVNPMRAQLKAVFGSDIAHWDVPDCLEVVEEVWEMVEHGKMTEADVRMMVLENPVRLHGGMNPDFFNGTSVEAEATKILAG